jgi:hypothetical protein
VAGKIEAAGALEGVAGGLVIFFSCIKSVK